MLKWMLSGRESSLTLEDSGQELDKGCAMEGKLNLNEREPETKKKVKQKEKNTKSHKN